MWQLIVSDSGTWVNALYKSNNVTWNYDGDSAVSVTFDSLHDFKNGSIISLMKSDKEIVRAIIIKRTEKKFTYSYTAIDYIWYFNKNKELIQFNNISAKRAIEQLCSRVNVKCDVANITTNIKKIYNQDLSGIIKDILDQALAETGVSYYKEMDKNIFVVKPIGEEKINCKYKMLNDFSLTHTIEDLKNSIIITSGSEENEKIVATAEDKNSINNIGRLRDVVNIDENNISKANNMAKTLLTINNKENWEMPLDILGLEGCEYIKANRLLYVKIASKNIEGWYRVKSANHSLANGSHKVSLTFCG